MPSLACLCRFQVAVKGQALLAVQAGCCSGLSQPGGPYRPLKEAHHNLPFRDASTTTCTDERDVSVGKVCSSDLGWSVACYCPVTDKHHNVPLQDACTAACTSERDASMKETAAMTWASLMHTIALLKSTTVSPFKTLAQLPAQMGGM